MENSDARIGFNLMWFIWLDLAVCFNLRPNVERDHGV